jgi:hypothetical protein
MTTDDNVKGRAKGGVARAKALSDERKKEIAMSGVLARKERAKLPKATHFGEIKIGDIVIRCFVLDDGRRVISGRGLTNAIGMKGRGQGVARISSNKLISSYKNKDLLVAIENPIKFIGKSPKGLEAPSDGFEATILQEICEAILSARDQGLVISEHDKRYAAQADILIRGFARVGIIALVDEATGYQKDRARDALAKILEAYVAKELQPYVRTFESTYYEHMFRLRGLPYPPDTSSSKPQYRPQYFGKLTNDIVYSRLAPGVLEALKEEAKKELKKTHLHRHLTAGYGRLELIKHLAIVTLLMKRAKDWQEFMIELNKEAPRYGDTYQIDLDEIDR